AHKPEIVKREDNGDAAPGQRCHDVRRQTRQVMYVGHVWLEFTDQTVRYSVYRGIPVRLFERASLAERVVDPGDREPFSHFASKGVLVARRILLARQDQHLVAMAFAQRARVLVRVDFAAALGHRWKPVNDDEDTHQTVLDRSALQPRAADRPPQYC